MAKALPRNAELADQLDLLADLSEILDEESFKVIAYRRAASRIRESPLPIAELALEGKAKELPGIGRTIESKVVEVVEDDEMHALTRRRGLVPPGVVDFLRLPGVGPKTAARFWTQLGITSLRRRSSRRSRRESESRPSRVVSWARRSRRCGGLRRSSLPIPRRSPSPRPGAFGDDARPYAISIS
jgi:hypothetical protein